MESSRSLDRTLRGRRIIELIWQIQIKFAPHLPLGERGLGVSEQFVQRQHRATGFPTPVIETVRTEIEAISQSFRLFDLCVCVRVHTLSKVGSNRALASLR